MEDFEDFEDDDIELAEFDTVEEALAWLIPIIRKSFLDEESMLTILNNYFDLVKGGVRVDKVSDLYNLDLNLYEILSDFDVTQFYHTTNSILEHEILALDTDFIIYLNSTETKSGKMEKFSLGTIVEVPILAETEFGLDYKGEGSYVFKT